MIYICIVAQNHAPTVGLVLWKVRQVFQEFPREYQVFVVDDGSTDGTAETLQPYQRALPMTVTRHETPKGYARSLELLLDQAVERSDRPRRDCVVTLPADFTVSPATVPELIKRFESGADVVVGETVAGDRSFGMRLVRRSAPWLLKPGLSLPGVRDLTSGVSVLRLITLKNCFRERGDGHGLLNTDGCCASAELLARCATKARQIAAVTLPPAPHATDAEPAASPLTVAVSLFRAGRRLRIPAPATEIQRP